MFDWSLEIFKWTLRRILSDEKSSICSFLLKNIVKWNDIEFEDSYHCVF